MESAGLETELEKTDSHIVNSWLGTLYPKFRDTGNYKTMICYVDPNKLTDFYERRQNALGEFLENNGQTGAKKDYLLRINAKVDKPFRYEWTDDDCQVFAVWCTEGIGLNSLSGKWG